MKFRVGKKEKRVKVNRKRGWCEYSWNVTNNAHWVKRHFKIAYSFSEACRDFEEGKSKKCKCESESSLCWDQYKPTQKKIGNI
jgi:hypothetical protein